MGVVESSRIPVIESSYSEHVDLREIAVGIAPLVCHPGFPLSCRSRGFLGPGLSNFATCDLGPWDRGAGLAATVVDTRLSESSGLNLGCAAAGRRVGRE